MARAASLLPVLLLAAACDVADVRRTLDDIQPVIAVDTFAVVVSGVVMDAGTGALVENAMVLIGDEARDVAVDLFGKPVEVLRARGGAVSFALENSVQPSLDRPFVARLSAAAEGYRSNSTRISITRPGEAEFRLFLDRESAPLAAGTTVEARVVLRGSTTVDSVRISHASGLLDVVVPQGLGLSSPEPTATIRASLYPPSEALFATFPGGMDAGISQGEHAGSSLTTGALVRVGGAVAFSHDSVRVTTAVSRSLLSPLTNEAVRAGDDVNVLRWDPEEGVWTQASTAVLVRKGGALSATFHAARPGAYSLGYFTTRCAPGRVTLTGNVSGGALLAYRGSPHRADGLRVWRFEPGQQTVDLVDPPDFWRGSLLILHAEEVLETPYTTLCGEDFELDLGRAAPVEPAPILLDPGACGPLRVTGLPTLVGLSIPQAPGRATAVERIRQAPYVRPRPRVERDPVARIRRLELDVPPGEMLLLAIGGHSWPRDLISGRERVSIADLASELNLCSAEDAG